jgi:hypothetical protein
MLEPSTDNIKAVAAEDSTKNNCPIKGMNSNVATNKLCGKISNIIAMRLIEVIDCCSLLKIDNK